MSIVQSLKVGFIASPNTMSKNTLLDTSFGSSVNIVINIL
jgi:hypothetical protein